MGIGTLALMFCFGGLIGFVIGTIWGESRRVRHEVEDVREEQAGPVYRAPEYKHPPYKGPGLMPYTVNPDGVIEYADGRRVDPSAPPIPITRYPEPELELED